MTITPTARSGAETPTRKSGIGALVWRILIVTHRYLGVVLGLLMLVWFLSGIVMMYVPYPQRGEWERTRALPPIPWQSCCTFAAVDWRDDQEVPRAQIENVAGAPVLRLRRPPRADLIVDLATGREQPIDEAAARAIGEASAARIIGPNAQIRSLELIEQDQWTVGDNGINRRPVYRITYDDPSATRLYVSSITGEVIVWTTRSQRFWNWLGAIPHWLYFTELRRNGYVWGQIIIWTSLLGTFLTVIGLYIGIARFKKSKSGRLSPYAGWFYWHHLISLAFGIVTLTWVLSGLFSMQPWGLLESRGGDEQERLAGDPITWGNIRASLETMRSRDMGDIVSLTTMPLDGMLHWRAAHADGRVERLDANGAPAPATEEELAATARRLAGERPIESSELITEEDSYYFRFNGFAERNPLVMPVYRVVLGDAEHTRLYLDPETGTLLRRVDSGARAYRWWFEGLHRFDFASWLRSRPLWDIIVLFLMLGGTAGVFTGVWLGVRRVRIDLSRTSR